MPYASHAFDFTWTPTARSMMRLDDNIRGSSRNEESAVGFDLGGGVNLRAQSETLTSEIFPRFNIRRFAVGEDLDADEYSVAFNNDWLQPYYAAGLDFSYVRDSTLSTEITDTGRLNDVTDRDTISVSPNATYFVNDQLALQSSFVFNDVAYLDAETTGFFDYRYLQGNAGANYQWRYDVLLFANFFVSDFTVTDLDSQTRSYGGQSGATYKWDETLEFTGALGWIASNSTFTEQQLAVVFDPFPRIAVIENPVGVSTAGPIASVNILKIFDTVTAKFDYSRQVSPSGRGSQSSSDRIALFLNKRLTSLLSVQFDGVHEIRTAEGQNANPNARVQDLNRDYSELRGTARYRVSKAWAVSASYRHARTQSTNLNSSFSADRNSIYFIVDYNGLPNTFWNGF